MEEDYSDESKALCFAAGVAGIFGSILNNANRAELDRQMVINERYEAELHHRRAMAKNALERKRIDAEIRKLEIQAGCFRELIEYKTHQFDRCMDFAQQKLALLDKQLEIATLYYQTERDALSEQRRLCIEEKLKARSQGDATLYSQMSSTIREIDRNMERIDCEFSSCNQRVTNMMNSLSLDYQPYNDFSDVRFLT